MNAILNSAALCALVAGWYLFSWATSVEPRWFYFANGIALYLGICLLSYRIYTQRCVLPKPLIALAFLMSVRMLHWLCISALDPLIESPASLNVLSGGVVAKEILYPLSASLLVAFVAYFPLSRLFIRTYWSVSVFVGMLLVIRHFPTPASFHINMGHMVVVVWRLVCLMVVLPLTLLAIHRSENRPFRRMKWASGTF